MKFFITDFFSKCDQIRQSYLLKKSVMAKFNFCAVIDAQSGGLLVYAKWSIPTRIRTCYKKLPRTQIIAFEINLRKEKCLFVDDYKPICLMPYEEMFVF